MRVGTALGLCVLSAWAGLGSSQVLESNYACSNCLNNPDGTPKTLRAMFIHVDMGCENPAARIALGRLKDPARIYPGACDDVAKAVPECFVAANWNSGWMCAATADIFEQLGLNMVASTRANFTQASRDLYKGGSSYTRCMWEIVAGNQDMCVSDFWQTAERAKVMTFTTAVDNDVMKLVTMPVGGASALEERGFAVQDFTVDNIIGIFKPFTWPVWGVTVAYFVFGGMLLWLVEGICNGNEDYIEPAYEGIVNQRLGGTLKAVYAGVMDYWLAGASFLTVSSWPGRIIVMGYGLFIFITGASYTANLVQFMVADSTPDKMVTSLDHMVATGGKLCVIEAASAAIMASYGLKEENVLIVDSYGPVVENLYLNRCQVGVLGKNEYQALGLAQVGKFDVCTDEADGRWWSECKDDSVKPTTIDLACSCKDFSKDVSVRRVKQQECPEECPYAKRYCPFQRTDPDFYFEFSFSMPIRAEFEQYVSAWLNLKASEGELFNLHQEFVVNRLRDVCSAGEVEAESLGLAGFLGTVLITVALLLIGLCLGLVQMFQGKKKTHPPDTEPDSAPTDKADVAKSIALGRVTPFQSRITDKEQLVALSQKVVQLKEKIDNFKQKPKKTVKKKAANASIAPSGEQLDVPIKSSQDVPIPMSNQPPTSDPARESKDANPEEVDVFGTFLSTVTFGHVGGRATNGK